MGGHRARPGRFGIAVATVLVAAALGPVGRAGATIASDQAEIVRIQQQIATDGARVRTLVQRQNAAQTKAAVLRRRAAITERRIAADLRAEADARAVLQRVAINAYVTGPNLDSPVIDMFTDTSSATASLTHHQYLGAISSNVSEALDAVQQARHDTEADQHHLRSAQSDIAHTVADIDKQRRAVKAAIATEQAALVKVKNDLQGLVLADLARQAAAERGLANYHWPTADGQAMPIPPPKPGVYLNPLRDVQGLVPERIDMGVDFAGLGPIYAIGNGIVLATSVPGWPGGTMIVYQLTDGPANGLVVYAAEDIAPMVQIGDTVTATTVLGLVYPGPDGIETGWGDPNVIGNALAGDTHQFDGGNTTAFGANFAQLLHSLGAPMGIPQNDPPTGALPSNWPQWSPSPFPPPPVVPGH